MSTEGTLRIKARAASREVLAIVTNDNDDELAAMKLRSPEEVKTVIYGLIRAMAIAWPEEGGK